MRAVVAEPDALLIPIRFQGQWEDAETGLYYNRFRYYEPAAGQYISVDPLRLGGGPSPQAFVQTPSIEYDPLGWNKCCCLRSVAGAAAGVGEDIAGRWLIPTGAAVPKSVAQALAGRQFSSFDAFREAFWKAAAADASLASQFTSQNVARMGNGMAPFAPVSGQVGGRMSFELDHINPVAQGGALYDVDNLRVRTPRDHIDRHRGGDGC